MKLNAETPNGRYAITSYGPGFVVINGQTYRHSLVIGYDRQATQWSVASFDELSPESLEALAQGSEVILLGTGTRQRFPHPSILQPLFEKRIGTEIMDTPAACRTYNILLAEGRAVVAALIIE